MLLFLFLFFQTFILHSSAQIQCKDNGNFTRNSEYINNLDTVISSLPTNIGITGFYHASAGSRDPDIAYLIALCQADLKGKDCRNCVQGIAASIRWLCPNKREVMQWRDPCMVRYSNESMLGVLINTPQYYSFNSGNVLNPTIFMHNLFDLIDNLIIRAAQGGPLRKFSFGNVTVNGANGTQSIFAMLQCTPDLDVGQCTDCLRLAGRRIDDCCSGSSNARITLPSCNLPYDIINFYNETRLLELQHTPSPPPAPQPPLVTLQIPPPASGNNRTRTIIIVLVSIVVFMVLFVFIWILSRRMMKRQPMTSHREIIEDMSIAESLKLELNTLKVATNDFSENNKLGKGGFGAVYKGRLPNNREIAVKRLSRNSGQGNQEFTNEVVLLAKLRHRNLVRLIGFCGEGMEKLLVYEFVENASLDKFIFDPIKRPYLDWEKRRKIICGIARGLVYLHEDSRVKIIHRDLKLGNVLLDGAMNPKIADFGLARLFSYLVKKRHM